MADELTRILQYLARAHRPFHVGQNETAFAKLTFLHQFHHPVGKGITRFDKELGAAHVVIATIADALINSFVFLFIVLFPYSYLRSVIFAHATGSRFSQAVGSDSHKRFGSSGLILRWEVASSRGGHATLPWEQEPPNRK